MSGALDGLGPADLHHARHMAGQLERVAARRDAALYALIEARVASVIAYHDARRSRGAHGGAARLLRRKRAAALRALLGPGPELGWLADVGPWLAARGAEGSASSQSGRAVHEVLGAKEPQGEGGEVRVRAMRLKLCPGLGGAGGQSSHRVELIAWPAALDASGRPVLGRGAGARREAHETLGGLTRALESVHLPWLFAAI